MYAYATVCIAPNITLTCAHELGHSFGSQHDDDSYDKLGNLIPGYHTSSCSGSDIPIMCSHAISNGPNYYFSSYTRNIILNSASIHSACLSDWWQGTPVTSAIKSWSNWQNERWVATWLMQNQDYRVAGNFDGEAGGDEEIFFAAPDNGWVGIMDFSCDQGTDWYHMWGNSGNGRFGSWVRHTGDKYLAGDFDGNGKSELFSVSGDKNWSALQEYNPSTWSWSHKYGNNGTRWMAGWWINSNDTYVIGDFDGDGKDELFCVNPNGWAQIVKFIWKGTYFTPQTYWSNQGNHVVGSQNISNVYRWFKGKMKTTQQDELFTLGSAYTGVMRYYNSDFHFITGESETTSFTTPNTTPASTGFRFMGVGNIDNDSYDEYVAISNQWIGTQDYSAGGPGMTHNWNNNGSTLLNDWNLNTDNDYLLVKAAPTSSKQILGIHSALKSTGWGPWSSGTWTPTLVGMYRTNAATQNYRMILPITSSTGHSSNPVRFYPNPTTDIVNVGQDDDVESAVVTISDITGRQIGNILVTQINKQISLRGYPAGIYVLHVQLSDKSSFTSKITVYAH